MTAAATRPGRSLGQTDGVAHRVGIIGLGTVGGRFVEQFGLHPAFEVSAAWDRSPDACARYADEVTVVGSASEVIDRADAVYIAVPPHHHREYVEACLASGTAIFCEKPLGIDVAESEQLVAAVEASDVPAGVNFVYSSAPAAVELGDAVGGGALGEVVSAELRLHFAEWPRAWQAEATWLADRDQGGWVREVASHHLFLLGRVLGSTTLESASATYPEGPDGVRCETHALAQLSAGDLPITLAGTVGGAGPDIVELTVRGTAGSMRVADWYRVESTDGGPWTATSDADRPALAAAAYAAQLDELDAMLSGRPHRLATFDEALAVQRLAESILT